MTDHQPPARERLLEHELLLRSVSDSLPDGYLFQFTRGPGGLLRYDYVSAGVAGLRGVTPEQVYADAEVLHARLVPEDRLRYEAAVARASRELATYTFEGRVRLPDGRLRWVQIRASPHRQAGQVVWSGVETDITARKQIEEDLRRRVDELEALNLIAQGLTSHTDVAQGVVAVGPLIRTLFDAATIAVWAHSRGDGTLRRLISIDGAGLVAGDEQLPAELSGAALAGPPVKVVALEPGDPRLGGGRRDGGARSALLVTLVARNEPIGLLCIGAARREQLYLPSDVALAQTVGGLLASAVENARIFAQAQSAAAERERRRLARELHDSVSQALYAANRAAETIPVIWELDPDEGRERLGHLQHFTHSALAEMQTLLVELRPRALVETPLHKTLGLLAEALAAKGGLEVETRLELVPLLPPDVQVMLYRIAQEALTNVGKHARASRVRLELKPAPALAAGRAWQGAIALRVVDDGRGFALAEVEAGRMGLHSMHERAAELGAELSVVSSPGAGTVIAVTWRSVALASAGPRAGQRPGDH